MEVTKSQITFGRSRDCDFPLDHPSISRNHAVIKWIPIPNQESKGKFFLQDLSSTHGSFVNKMKLSAGQTVRLEVNNSILKFGGSTRTFLLNSTDPLYEETQEKISNDEDAEEDDDEESDGEAEDDLEVLYEKISIFLQKEIPATKNEHSFSGNPVKSIQDWFEREELDFEYEVSHNNNNFRCKLDVNIEGRTFSISSDPHSKKKDSIAQACLHACRLLDAFKLLYPWQSEKTRKRKVTSADKTEEDVLDETSETRQSIKEMKSANKTPETYESLLQKWTECTQKLSSCKASLASFATKIKPAVEAETESEEKDSLDSFMMGMKSSGNEKSDRDVKIQQSKLKLQIKELEKKQRVYELLMKAAKPTANLSSVKHVSMTGDKEVEKKCDTSSRQSLLPPVIQSNSFNISLRNPLLEDEDKPQEPPAKKTHVDTGVSVSQESSSSTKKGKMSFPVSIPSVKKSSVKTSETLDDNFIEWVPPKGQDGSGKTALNDKLGY